MKPAASPQTVLSFLQSHWPVLLLIAGIVILLAIASILLVRRRRARPAAGPSISRRLEHLYKPFYRRLPRHARHFPTIIVMGEAGAGKSQLIDTHVDWRGQTHQYLPGAAQGDLVQLYLGPDAIVHELSAQLLHDTSAGARRALSKLWHLGRGPAVVIIAVSAHDLAAPRPDALRGLAQLVRGKLRILAARRPVELRVCLTHLDQVPGYHDLAYNLGARLRGLALDLGTADEVAAQLEAQLTRALMRQRPDAFRRMVGFCQAFPARFAALAPFLRSLCGDEPFAPRYRVDALCLSAPGRDAQVGTPFSVSRAAVIHGMRVSRRRHVMASLALGSAMVASLLGVGLWHGDHVRDAERAVIALERTTAGQSGIGIDGTPAVDAAERAAAGSIARLQQTEHLLLDHTFTPRKQRLRERFLDAMRRAYLLPRVRAGADRIELLYTVSLLHAARDTALGELVLSESSRWAEGLDIPERAVIDYVTLSDRPWTSPVTLPPDATEPAAFDTAAWRAYLADLQRLLGQERITPAELDALRARTPLLGQSDELGVLSEAAALLEQDPQLQGLVASLPVQRRRSAWMREHHATLATITERVRRARLDVPPARGWSLSRLVDELALQTGPAGPYPLHELSIDGETIAIDEGAWVALIARSRAGLLLDDFLADIAATERSPFFVPDAALPDEGASVEPGQGPQRAIRGMYTRAAFERYVAPALAPLSAGIEHLPLGARDRVRLERLVRDGIEAYAREYGKELRRYYRSVAFEASSPAMLAPALASLIEPASSLERFLRTVAHQASLDLGDSAYEAPMRQAVSRFEAVVALMVEDADGNLPQLEPYKQVVAALLPHVEAAAVGAGVGSEEAEGLELSTLGALALEAIQAPDKDQAAIVRQWLSSVGIKGSRQDPFLEPVQRVYGLGRANIEAEVARAWRDVVFPEVADLVMGFPFRRYARHDISVAELEAVLRPGKEPGRFWAVFHPYFDAVCVRDRKGRWKMRGRLDAPRGMLLLADALARVSDTLWDGDGNRVALSLRVTPRPLPVGSVNGRMATRAYLRADSNSVFAFNQRPRPEKLEIAWWEQTSASVGVVLSAPDGDGGDEPRAIDMAGEWSFYKILRKAVISSEDMATWQIPVTRGSRREIAVRFGFEKDPWALFRLPGDNEKRGE